MEEQGSLFDDAPKPPPAATPEQHSGLHPDQFNGQPQQQGGGYIFSGAQQASISKRVQAGLGEARERMAGNAVRFEGNATPRPIEKIGPVAASSAQHNRPYFAMSSNLRHEQFGQVYMRSPQKVTIHHGRFTGGAQGVYQPETNQAGRDR